MELILAMPFADFQAKAQVEKQQCAKSTSLTHPLLCHILSPSEVDLRDNSMSRSRRSMVLCVVAIVCRGELTQKKQDQVETDRRAVAEAMAEQGISYSCP